MRVHIMGLLECDTA